MDEFLLQGRPKAAGLIIATIRYKKILTKSIPFKQAANENTEELLR